MKTNMTKETICKILAGEHINYICREANRILPNCAAAIISHTASNLERWNQVRDYLLKTDCAKANAEMHYQIPAEIWKAMQEAAK